jgi:hypothetical protein
MDQGIHYGGRGTILGMPRSKPRVAHAERRVIADLQSWKVDPELIAEVREAFDVKDTSRAMALARDLGWKPNMPPRKTRAELERDIAEVLTKRPLIDNRRAFWDTFEEVAARDIGNDKKKSTTYNVGSGVEVKRDTDNDEPAEVFARRIRNAVENYVDTRGFTGLNYNSRIFEKFGRRLGFKVHTKANLKTAYEQMS